MRKNKPESLSLQDEKSNFRSLVAPVPASPWITMAKTWRMSSPKKFLLQTRVSMFVAGRTSQSFLKPLGPISLRETSSSLRFGAWARLYARRIIPWSPMTFPLMLREVSEEFLVIPWAMLLVP